MRRLKLILKLNSDLKSERGFDLTKLILGTANFGQEYNGKLVSEQEISRILFYCLSNGIRTLDTAAAYNWQVPETCKFDVITKIRVGDKIPPIGSVTGCLVHHIEDFDDLWPKIQGKGYDVGLSVYNSDLPCSVTELDILQFPHNIEHGYLKHAVVSWQEDSPKTKLVVRSIFGRGELLKRYSVEDCFKCVKHDLGGIWGVVVGVDSLNQLQEVYEGFRAVYG